VHILGIFMEMVLGYGLSMGEALFTLFLDGGRAKMEHLWIFIALRDVLMLCEGS
jgi:hypothetical protein